MSSPITIGRSLVGGPATYVIAEVGSNFDGDLDRAKYLAKLAKECGADAYKIQNFLAPKIVSAEGFKGLQVAFQAKWDQPVVDVYRAAEFPREWVGIVAAYCREIGIDFFSSPYDTEAVDMLENLGVPAHKLGSGEIDNLPFLRYVARTGKPIILACGAATLSEIEDAVTALRSEGNGRIILLQCVTNYPASIGDSNIKAMLTLKEKFDVIVGYSDHTIGTSGGGDDPLGGITVPLAAVALGAAVIEKHFTDDPTRTGPDHPFAMDAGSFAIMTASIRALEHALGDGDKRVMPGEQQTVIIQRRGLYLRRDVPAGERITEEMIELLRPASGLRPRDMVRVIGKVARRALTKGHPLTFEDVS